MEDEEEEAHEKEEEEEAAQEAQIKPRPHTSISEVVATSEYNLESAVWKI